MIVYRNPVQLDLHDVSSWIFNLFNNAPHWGLGKPDIAPSLLTRSVLYDAIADVEILPPQHYLLRGFAFPGLVPASISHRFPYPSIVSADPGADKSLFLSDWEMKQVCGLGFHKAATTAVLTYGWSSSRLRTVGHSSHSS